MTDYVSKTLHRLQIELLKSPQCALRCYNTPVYGQKVQVTNPQDDEVVLLPAFTKQLNQNIIGIFLYYGLDLNLTMLVTLGSVASEYSKSTDFTWDDIIWFLNYAATNPDATICYEKSDTTLYISSDRSYLSKTRAISKNGGIFFSSNKPNNPNQGLDLKHPLNTPVHVVARILKMITSSTMEREVAATFYNAKDGLPIRVTLEEMGHPQSSTHIEADNETIIVFLNDTMK